MDEGYTNPAVILLIGIDGDGRWHLFREYYERGALQSVVVNQAHEWMSVHDDVRVTTVAVDESAAGLIADLNNSGVPAQGAKGRVLDGIQAIQDRLKIQPDGKPRLTVDPSCVNAINEFESYTWKITNAGMSKDEPNKENDHALDAIRYLNDAIIPIQIF
jgi:phage terminase large subunit